MPYKILKRKNKFLVVNKETGKVKGTHETKEKAVKQMRLLYKIEGDKKRKKSIRIKKRKYAKKD